MSDLNTLQSRLKEAKNILVSLPEKPSQDAIAAALSLYLSLKQANKSVSIVSSTKPVVRDSHLVGLDQITSDVGGDNLVITVNLPEDAVDKVTSNMEGGHLNLIIAPKSGQDPIKPENLTFGSSGANADLILTIGTSTLTDLGTLAEKEVELFTQDKIINLGNKNGNFASLNLTDPTSSNSELITALLQELKLPLDQDIANNLMQGIEIATSGLTSDKMTADTFEALAVLYRAGARRHAPRPNTPTAKIVDNTPIIDPQPEKRSDIPPKPPAPPKQVKDVNKDVNKKSDSASPDWLKPKIFKGGASTK